MKSPNLAQEVAGILEVAARKCSLSLAQTFDHFLDLGIAVLLADDAGFDKVKPSLLPAINDLNQAFALLLGAASEGYEDVLGSVYMANGQRDKKAFAQFFTPWPVAVMMGQMSDAGLKLKANDEPLRIFDPACGSGVMLLGVAEALPQEWIKEGQVEFSGLDADAVCVKMTYLNLLLHGLAEQTRVTYAFLSAPYRAAVGR